jgi:hypothetical protein
MRLSTIDHEFDSTIDSGSVTHFLVPRIFLGFFNILPGAAQTTRTVLNTVVMGHVEETWRFTESLFCGAIPFMERRVYDYYQHWLPSSLLNLIPYYENDNPIFLN